MFDKSLLRKVYFQSDDNKLSELISYLNYISGNELKESILRQYLFLTKWNTRESKMRSRCNCKAASIYLSHLLNNDPVVNVDKVKTIIAEIRPFVAVLDTSQEISFVFSTNVLPSSLHYKNAQYLFYNNDLPPNSKSNYGSDLLVMYALRLALEKRIRGFLGIDYATFNGKPIGVSKLIEVAKSLESIEYSKVINWDQVEWVNNWLNHHMHRNLRPYPWIIHQAFLVLDNLLLPSSYEYEDRVINSNYASTVVSNEEQLTNEILIKLQRNGAEVKIQWCNSKEILIRN